MSDRSVFEKLAETLPEKERRELLDKIMRSMSFGDNLDEAVYDKQMTVDEREALIKRDLDQLPLFSRFVLWIRGAISGKSKKNLLVSSKIRALKSAIHRRYPGLTGFETRDLRPRFAEAVFEIYKLALPLAPIYRQLLIRSREMEGAFLKLVEDRYPATRVDLQDIVSLEELEEVYEEKGQEQAVRRALIDKLDRFATTLDDRVFDEIEEEIIPVFYLKDIIFFPYGPFFELFHVPLSGLLADDPPEFRSASAMLAVEYLEKLHFAIYNASKAAGAARIHRNVANYLASLEAREGTTDRAERRVAARTGRAELFGGELDAAYLAVEPMDERIYDEDDGGEEGEGERSEAVDALVSDFTALSEAVRGFERRMPLVELIRFFLRDPYHRMYVYPPRIRLRDYYLAVLKVRLLAELNELEPELRLNVVDHKIERIFKGQRLAEFLHYREYRSIDYERMGLPFFSRTKSLNLLYNFIHWYYHEYVQELVKILSTVILVQNRVTRNKLLQHATTIEDLEQKIRSFDESLSPDSEEGKVFLRLRSSLAGDTGHQRMFRAVVLQKDSHVNGLIERGRESFTGLQRVFEEVYLTPSESVRERISSRFYLNGRLEPLARLLKDRAEYVRDFLAVFSQVTRLEGA